MQVIIPGEPMRYGLRLVAYQPNGPRLGVLGQHLGFKAGMPHNDVSSLRLSYPAGAAGAEWLESPVEIALEYAAAGGWVESANGRFLRIKRGGDNTDQTGKRSYDCPGYAWMTRKLVLYPGGQPLVEGKRPFNAVSAGAILRTLVNEAHARGTLSHLAVDVTTERDSDGQFWDKALTLALEPGTDLMALLLNLAEQGVIDWQVSGRTLRVFNEGGELGRDLASGPGPVDLRLGRDVDQAPDDATLEDVSSAILIAGESSLSVEVTNRPRPRRGAGGRATRSKAELRTRGLRGCSRSTRWNGRRRSGYS